MSVKTALECVSGAAIAPIIMHIHPATMLLNTSNGFEEYTNTLQENQIDKAL